MKWWDQMPWSSFFECWVLSQIFHFYLFFIKRLFSSSSLSAIRVVSAASCLFKISTNQLLLGKRLPFLGLEKEADESSTPFSQEASWNFCFFLLLRSFTFLLTLLWGTSVFWRCQGNCSQPFLFLLPEFLLLFLQFPSNLSSDFLFLNHRLLQDIQISRNLSSQWGNSLFFFFLKLIM